MPQEPARIALKPAQARSSLSREGKLAGVADDVDLTVRLRAADRRRYVRRQNSLGANSCVTEKSVRALSRRWTLQCLWKRLRWRLIKSRRYGYQSLPQPPVWNLGTSELFRQIANDRGCLDHPSLESRLDLHVDRQPLLMRRDLCGILRRQRGEADEPEARRERGNRATCVLGSQHPCSLPGQTRIRVRSTDHMSDEARPEAAPSPGEPAVATTVVVAPAPRSRTLAWLRRFAKLWGVALFCIFIVFIFREVALPFLFAILVAYILAPVVDRFERFKIRGKPFPRGLAVIIVYINIIAALSIFIGYFVPRLSGDFARMFREAPQLIARINKDWVPKAGAWIDQRFSSTTAEPAPEADDIAEAPPAPDAPETIGPLERPDRPDRPWRDRHRGLIFEPLPDGKMRIDMQSLRFEVQPGPGGSYVISQARPDTPDTAGVGKWERSIKSWLGERMKSTEGQTRRALEWGQKFVAAIVSGVARLVLE